MKRTISFIQLPLVNHTYDYIQGNIEYASASIAGYIHNYIDRDIHLLIIPRMLALYGSDSLIVNYILSNPPDVMAFTCYLWNIERSLHIAHMIRQKNSDIQIIFGGSEIQQGSISISEWREYVDYFVIGEGEWFFGKLLSGEALDSFVVKVNKNRVVIQPHDNRIPVEMICEPFTGKIIDPMDDGSMFFEMTRGCPYRCMYCLYSKNYSGIRELSFNLLVTLLKDRNLTERLKELYILSPSFNTTEHFSEKLEILAHLKHGIRLHSEMRADSIDRKMAELLYRAGFRSMEVGLQTMNIYSLKSVGRRGDPEIEINGMIELKRAGIDLKIGLIPGLPGDTKEVFLRTVDALMARGFEENIELYPLMMLPGTRIMDKAVEEDINFSRKPPYYYNYGWGTSFEDIRYITKYVEDATGYSHITSRIPDFTGTDQGTYCRGVRFNGDTINAWDYGRYEQYVETNVFNFYIDTSHQEILYRGLPVLMNKFPQHQLYNIIVYYDDVLDERPVIDCLTRHEEDSLLRRIYIFHEWKEGLTVRVYQVFDRIERYLQAKNTYTVVTPIFRIHDSNYNAISSIRDYEDNVLVSRGAFRYVRKEMRKYADAAEKIAFEDIEEQKEFYAMIGYDYLELPYTLKILAM